MAYFDYGQNDSGGAYYASSGDAYKFDYSTGIYAGAFPGNTNAGYAGLTWMKNVFIMTRDFWDTSLSTPYTGQIFPTGGGVGGPGQVYPY